MLYQIVPASQQHVEAMLPHVREADRQEVEAMGVSLREGLVSSLNDALWARVALTEDGIACIWGVRAKSILGGVGVPWLIGTDVLLMRKYRKAFLTESRLQLAEMRNAFPVLLNYVSENNVAAVRWLKWLGCEFRPAVPFGGVRFVPFQIGG